MAARILAFVVALAMVAGAIWYRGQQDDDDPDAPADVAADAPLRLVCATELQVPCTAIAEAADGDLSVVVEPAGDTAERLKTVRGAAGLEAWMTPGPWPGLVHDARQRAGLDPLLQAPAAPVGRGRLGVVIWKERAAALTRRCAVDLKCVTDAAADGAWTKSGGQATWGEFKLGITDPVTEAGGLTALAAATVAFFGTSDVSTTDLERDDYQRWLAGLVRSTRPGDVGRMLAFGPAELDAVVTFEHLVSIPAARAGDVTVIYPSAVASADVVLGTVPGKRADRLVELLRGEGARRALARASWQARPAPPRSLPDAGLLEALRAAWRGVRR